METQTLTSAQSLSSHRRFLLTLSTLASLVMLSAILLFVGSVEAEPLAPAAEISGTVVNPDGSAITDTAWVCLMHFHPTEGWIDWDACKDSDANGSFSFTGTIPLGDLFVQAEPPWYSDYLLSVPAPFYLGDAGDVIDMGNITLTYASFAGMVYEPDGMTLATEGKVTVDTWDGWEWYDVAGAEYQTGTYAIGGVPPGEFMLVAHPPEDSLFWGSDPISVSVAPGSQYISTATQPYSLTLQDPNLVGEVVYPGGDPVTWIISGADEIVGQAWVEVAHQWDYQLYHERPTASWGEFGFLVPSGDYHVWARPEGELVMTYTHSVPRFVRVPTGTLMLPVDPLTLTYPSFVGLVLDPAGNPITDCLDVWLEDMYGELMASYWYCGEESAPYRLGGVLNGDYWLMTGGIPELGLFPAKPIEVHVAPGSQYDPFATQFISLTLTGPQLDVFVEHPPGTPIPAHVVLWDDWGHEEWLFTPDGLAQFGNLEHGDYWIQAWPDEPDIPALANSEIMPVFVGPDTISRTLVLQTPNITGTVETPEGNPLPPTYDEWMNPMHPAEVHVHNTDWSVDLWAVTNMAGEFGLALPPDDYALVAYPSGGLAFTYTKSHLESFSLPGPVNLGYIRLTYPRIWGWVVDPYGERVSTSVNVWSEDWSYEDWGDTSWYPPDEIKPFQFGGMPPGHYFVQSDPPWDNPEGYGSSNIIEFDVPPTYTEQITLYLGTANVVGSVLLPPDDPHCPDCPVPWVDVMVHTPDWSFEDWAMTDEAGQFVFSGLEPGVQYVLDVYLWDEWLMEWDPPDPWPFILASPDDQVNPTLYLQPAVRTKHVVGEVFDEGGNPVDDATVFAHHEGSGRWIDTHTDWDGSYDFYLDGGLWKLGVKPMHPHEADWYFDPDRPLGGEQWVWFPPTPTLWLTETVFFTVTRFTEGDFLQVSGWVDDPAGNPPPSDTSWVDLCTDEGHCFGAPVEASGRFTITTLPGIYEVWVWVDSDTGFLPPLDNGFTIIVDEDLDLGVLQLRALADRTAQVSGRVIITPTGQGLSGVEIEAWTDEGDWNVVETATDGNYVIDLFPGHWHVDPVLTPEQAEDYIVLPPQHQDGHVGDGETIADVNFFLQRRDATIRGHVVDEAGEIITDTELAALVFAEVCRPNPIDLTAPDLCWIVDEDQVRDGRFGLKVLGDMTYTLGIWPMSGGYIPGDPVYPVPMSAGETITGVEVTLLEARAEIYGCLMEPGEITCIQDIEASVFAANPDGYWVEDLIWPDKGSPEYQLWVTDQTTWTLGLWVDPHSGYIVDPTYSGEDIWVSEPDQVIQRILPVVPLDTFITGTVTAGGAPTPYIWVFAEGLENTDSEGLYFEAETDENGGFSMPVLSGEYLVRAYLPPDPDFAAYFPPLPVEWASMDDNPVELAFRPRAGQEVEISGALSVTPTGSLPGDVPILVFGWSDEGDFNEVTGTLDNGYVLPVTANATWYVWAVYEDPGDNAYYYSQEEVVDVGSTPVPNVDLLLELSEFDLPDTECWTFDSTRFKRLVLPARNDLPEPLVEIQAGTMPVTGTVEICATPKVAMFGGQNLVGFAYEMEARDSQGNLITEDFNKKVRLIFYFTEDAIPGDVDPEELEVVYYSTVRQEWVSLEDVFIDPEDLFATGKINHFSRMGVMSAPPPTADHNIYLPLVLKSFEG
ncbi:MAG: hypothetical protein SXV54_07035 [Chloroflexota bacterium]|nr:hypothetical protein [Chloroflexota bacterium]